MTRLWLGAAAVPCLATAVSRVVTVEPSAWFTMTDSARRGATAGAFLYVASALILAAPLAGVALGTAGRRATHDGGDSRARIAALASLVGAVVVFIVMSGILTMIGWGPTDRVVLQFVAVSHATLGAVGLALAAFGAFCGGAFRDSLDAAAASLAVVLVATVGLLVAGAAVGELPRSVIQAGLTASPLVAITSAAEIDLIRMGVPYQISPLAHLQVEYPTWYVACIWYLAVAAVCAVGFTWTVGGWRDMPSPERMVA